MARPLPHQSGFSLLEVLVGVAVLAVMSTIAFSALNQMTLSSSVMRDEADRFSRLSLALSLFEKDFRHAVPRSVRDLLGTEVPALTGNRLSTSVTSAGLSNPLDLQRSNLQRIEYLFDARTLRRVAWPVLDRTQSTEPRIQVLLEDIDQLDLEYFDDTTDEWTRTWPPIREATTDTRAWPRAIRLVLQSTVYGHVERLIVLPQPIATPTSR